MRKAIVIGVIVLLPVIAFLFLKFFGTNQYSLRTYFPQSIDSVQVDGEWKSDTVFKKVPDFTFTSQKGEAFSQKDLDGHIYVTDFFFATCPGICKRMSSQLSRVQEAFHDDSLVKIVSFTVNPEHDSAEVLMNYAEQYGANHDKWIFLTGNRDTIYDLAQRGFYLPVQKLDDTTDFIRSEKFMLVDTNKHVRGIYDGTDPKDVDRLITEIRILLHEYQPVSK